MATRHSQPAPSFYQLVLAYLAVYIIWGSTYLAIRFGVESFPPFLLAAVRWLIAGVLMFILARRSDRTPLTWANWRAAAVVGILMQVGGNGLVCWAELTIPSGLAALIIATVPIWMVLTDWVMMKGPRPTLTIAVGLALGLVGIYVLIDPFSSVRGLQPGGVLGLLAACIFWSIGSLLSRRLALPASTLTAAGMEMLCSCVVLFGIGLVRGEHLVIQPEAITMKSTLALVYLILFGSMIGLTAYLWILQVSPPAMASTYAYVNPVIAVLLGYFFAAEPLNSRTGISAAIIIAAVIIITRTPRRSG
ncbi:MAG: putative inner membrane transporter YedA [Phycisphaerae bacterium]|nr:putative inner membrane transporter YedA [Phycisphaerae bacterium]